MKTKFDDLLGYNQCGVVSELSDDRLSKTVYIRTRKQEGKTVDDCISFLREYGYLPIKHNTDYDCTGSWFEFDINTYEVDNYYYIISQLEIDC